MHIVLYLCFIFSKTEGFTYVYSLLFINIGILYCIISLWILLFACDGFCNNFHLFVCMWYDFYIGTHYLSSYVCIYAGIMRREGIGEGPSLVFRFLMTSMNTQDTYAFCFLSFISHVFVCICSKWKLLTRIEM